MKQAYQSMLQAGVEKKYRMLEEEIMKDVIRRIQKAGKVTSAADWQLQRYMVLGHSTEDVEAIIRQAVGGDWADTFRLYDEVIEQEYVRSKAMYEQVNAYFVPYEENHELQQLTNALVQQSNDELFNITKSLGFMVDMGKGRKEFAPLAEIYNGYLDNAITMLASGAFDYNTVIRKVVKEMTASGLRTVDYATGHSSRVDVAVRRALLTGMGQLAGRISDMNGQALGTDKFEVDWHPGARPDHAVWQGRVWTRQQLVDVCGLGQACWDGTAAIHTTRSSRGSPSGTIPMNGWPRWTGRKRRRSPSGERGTTPMKPPRSSARWRRQCAPSGRRCSC